jgi:hypothetical protein
MLDIIVQKHRSSFKGSRMPTLIPTHDCTATPDPWPCRLYENVGSSEDDRCCSDGESDCPIRTLRLGGTIRSYGMISRNGRLTQGLTRKEHVQRILCGWIRWVVAGKKLSSHCAGSSGVTHVSPGIAMGSISTKRFG